MGRKKIYRILISMALGTVFLVTTGCSKSQSYSELLREEEKAVNWYLAGKNVALELPEDPKDLITMEMAGEEAPFYKMDVDGYVYMQVVKADFSEMVSEGDLVYFRFIRESIKDLYEGVPTVPTGNSDYLPNGTTSFIYKNTLLSSSTTWGTGIQNPLQYVGYDSEVNLVLKSYYGFTDEQSYCIPYIINLRYFKPEY
ncbi:MAG: DUF4827 family protein [Muribaculaceae bacterium]|nr:DUF4827 family protein [Muribaculaceae bacterium]